MSLPPAPGAVRHPPLADRTVQLGRALQAAGVGVSLSEIIDAVRATALIDLLDRDQLRQALRATMVKQSRHDAAFDAAFDRCFPARVMRAGPDRPSPADPTDVVRAIATGDDLAGVASALVDDHGGLADELRSERFHLQRILLGADIARLMSRVRVADPDLPPELIRARVDELKRLIGSDLRAQLDHAAAQPDDDLLDIDFLEASRAELDSIRAVIRPVARKLAARMARRRNHGAGRVNMRRTMRRSLASGGVPIDVLHDRQRPHRPELFVLCDISGSVADFSLFTLSLVSALSAEIARTRSFVFVDAVDEITELLASTNHAIEPWSLLRNANVIGFDGHSDYANVFERFWCDVAERDLHPSSTMIITGDARTNHKGTGDDWLARIAGRARRVYWFNPEPRPDWGTYDSEIGTYSRRCSATFEVRNLRQLIAAVEQLF